MSSKIVKENVTEFKVGDWVYASDWVYGQIVSIDGNFADIEFDTGTGGGCLPFDISELTHAESPKKKNKKKKETEHERFVRVAEMRTQKVLDDLKALSKCARHDCYEYSEEEVEKIFGAIEAEFQAVKDTFAGLKRFSLQNPKITSSQDVYSTNIEEANIKRMKMIFDGWAAGFNGIPQWRPEIISSDGFILIDGKKLCPSNMPIDAVDIDSNIVVLWVDGEKNKKSTIYIDWPYEDDPFVDWICIEDNPTGKF